MRWTNSGVDCASSEENSSCTPRCVCPKNFEEISMARMQGVRRAETEIGEDLSGLQMLLEVFGFYLEGKGEFKG